MLLLKGRRVLPGVAHLEMARTAADLALESSGARPDGESRGLRIRGVVWTRPIVVEEPTDVHIALFPEKSGEIA
ncbi:MAG: hypothetical protein GY869_27510, partial [Planctomycetes bacterium]|nr:hypothetical protein [Planctomycetota bacterium]